MACFTVYEGGDDVTEGGKGEVNFGGFFQPLPFGFGFALTLRSCEIDEIQFSSFDP